MSDSKVQQITGVALWYLPIQTRVPLKFGRDVLTHVTLVRVSVRVTSGTGKQAVGWGETPLSVQWGWPSESTYEHRFSAMTSFCERLANAWGRLDTKSHPLALGRDFLEENLPRIWGDYNEERKRANEEAMPWLAALICDSAFDLALHDAFGQLMECPTYATYGRMMEGRDVADLLFGSSESTRPGFSGRYVADFLLPRRVERLPAWHLVGGLDPLDAAELTGNEPEDGYPVLLSDWIGRDGLTSLKVKLRGTDLSWDFDRLMKVVRLAGPLGVTHYTADFNCTVRDPGYVVEILDRWSREDPVSYAMLDYVEQPFPYDLEKHQIDVRAISKRKPLFLDESAHDWRAVRLGRELGWTGVALKTCKTQTGALLTACWARAHGMDLMVQDLTNPMLAQIPHCLLAAHVGTIRGVETNGMQFYPEASGPEADVHPGLYRRRNGELNLLSISGSGFGYRITEIRRTLPDPIVVVGEWS